MWNRAAAKPRNGIVDDYVLTIMSLYYMRVHASIRQDPSHRVAKACEKPQDTQSAAAQRNRGARAHLVETRSPWDQHTLARDAPSLNPNLPKSPILITSLFVLRVLEVAARSGGHHSPFCNPRRVNPPVVSPLEFRKGRPSSLHP